MKRFLASILLLVAASAQAQIAVGSATPKSARSGNSTFPEQQVFLAGAPGLVQIRNGNPETERRELGPVMGFVRNSTGYTSPLDNVVTTWAGGDSWTYTGQMYMTSGTTYTFGAKIDDYSTIDIDGVNVLTQSNFTTASYACTNTGWHDIAIRLWDVGGNYGYWSDFPLGIAYNTSGQTSMTPLAGWTQLVDPGDGSLFRTDKRMVLRSGVQVVAQMRESDPTVMDVDYIVYTDPDTTPTVNVRALAFEDGDRGFATVVRPETFIEGTDANLGDGIAANVAHRLSWKVSSDWATDLAKVKFEVMAMKPGDLLLPMHFVTIPAAEGHPKTIVSVNNLCDYSFGIKGRIPALLDALLWLFASNDESLILDNGELFSKTENGTKGSRLVAHNTFNPPNWYISEECSTVASAYVFGKMGFRRLDVANEIQWIRDDNRIPLSSGRKWSVPGEQLFDYAVKSVGE